MPFRLTLKEPNEGQDNYFLWSMVILPIVAECAYIFDGYYAISRSNNRHYAGLFSTILVVFTYLRYAAPIESRKILALYYIILCILNEAGTVGYLIGYIQHDNTYNVPIYILWGILEIIMTGCLIYYRVIKQRHQKFHLENKHLFQFVSRLEIILAIFIPFFLNNESLTLTKHSIAFFLLFDFFSESYNHFQGVWIKPILYLFVCTVSVSVATEWIFSTSDEHNVEIISSAFELISACLCDTLIIFQFIPYHFKAEDISQIARASLIFQQKTGTNSQMSGIDLKTIEVIVEPTLVKVLSKESVVDLEL